MTNSVKGGTVKRVSMKGTIGRGYGDFWHSKARYRVVKGSRASKKSKTAALWFITKLIKFPGANLLVVRKTFRTLKDSCYSDLIWAMRRLGVEKMFDCKESPLEITYRKTGQKILFRGLDDPQKITSISVSVGHLCWLWIEEAYEIGKEADFDMLDESIRGVVPEGLFKQVTLTFNPWNERHWLKKRFFDNPADNVFSKTTNYLCNEWLDEADRRKFEDMQVRNPRRYQVAGLGNWGIVEGVVYENWTDQEPFTLEEVRRIPGVTAVFGLDFGYTNDPSALFCGFVDVKGKRIFVWDEMYRKGMSNEAIYKQIYDMGYAKEKIIADAAEPKSIDRLRTLGLPRIRAARKGADSVKAGIDYVSDFKIIIHPRCVNFLTEIGNYTWEKDKFGNQINVPVDGFNHLMDAMRYALEDIARGKSFE